MAAEGSERARETVERAMRIIHERGADYGPPGEDLRRTAALWSAFFGIPISAKQVCMAQVLLKFSREVHRHKQDNIDDSIGYLLAHETIGGKDD